MIQAWVILLVALLYLVLLFAVASFGDSPVRKKRRQSQPNIYALSLAIYCTTWTFFGSVGLAASSGFNFLAIYLGPILLITVGFPVVERIVRLSKEQRITTVADFLGARYGKNLKVAAVATIIAVIGTVPYIALQLKAMSSSVETLLTFYGESEHPQTPIFKDLALPITLTLALFTILFGTRHADATEHQDGLILAIAMESVVKLAAFLGVGLFTVYIIFDGFSDLFSQAAANQEIQNIWAEGFDGSNFALLTFLSLTVFILLPRQFHVAVVENHTGNELRRARWLFPLYLVAINIFVIPIALAGMIKFGTTQNADDFVLILPMSQSSDFMSLLVFIGGLSAGTAMVVVACVALAIMISNDLLLPFYLRAQASPGANQNRNMTAPILNFRRASILLILFLAYTYYSLADNTVALASIGLISFVAIAQLGPAFFGGLYWKQATARGAIVGMIAGFSVWAYALLLPTLLPNDHTLLHHGLFGISGLRPQSLFGFELTAISNGLIWSLFFNILCYVIVSLIGQTDPLERMQAGLFVTFGSQSSRSGLANNMRITVNQLQDTVARYHGRDRTDRAFEGYLSGRGSSLGTNEYVDNDLLRFSEQLLASAIGASSSRLVHTLLLKRHDQSNHADIKLLDEASEALQFSTGVLQSALDQLDQGITVFDNEFRLASWNSQFRKLLNLPVSIGRAGTPLGTITEQICEQNHLNLPQLDSVELAKRLIEEDQSWFLDLPTGDKVLEISTAPIPGGGFVITWHDITESLRAAEALREANESLEQRVEERTSDLVKLNHQLKLATEEADSANRSKTRFLAAAGHDILQPLNAARLYSTTLQERLKSQKDLMLAKNVGKSLESVEEILSAVLAISRLDSGRFTSRTNNFNIQSVLDQLELEFAPVAKEKGLGLKFEKCDQPVQSDPGLLRRLLQNLISNAIKYTVTGEVKIVCMQHGPNLKVSVIDTGIGIEQAKQELVFSEFERLDEAAQHAPGLGLGLSIVERISALLGHDVQLKSSPGEGTQFSVTLPTAIASNDNLAANPKGTSSNLTRLEGTFVLCIDNDPNILEGMSGLLNQWGCRVDTALNIEQAVEALKNSSSLPDLILADYHLDQANGIEAIDKLRSTFHPALPAILITADRSVELKQEASSLKIPILNKPIKPAALRAIIAQERAAVEAAQ